MTVSILLRSTLWSCLPEELVLEVLSRLPDKEQLGLRCLSKRYCSLISKSLCPKLAALAPISGFVFQYKVIFDTTKLFLPSNRYRRIGDDEEWDYNYATPTGGFVPFGGELVKSYLSLLPFKPKKKDFIDCFNGFFLVRHRESPVANFQYFVCNPVTKQFVSIPVNSKPYSEESKRFVGLAFDPLLSAQLEQHNFKVVQISEDKERKGYPFLVDIFSSTNGKWDSYPVALEAKNLVFNERSRHFAYANGVFYILSINGRLVCFDLPAMDNTSDSITLIIKARSIKFPHNGRVHLFSSSRGCLYYTCIIGTELRVWTFHDGEAFPWILKYTISSQQLKHVDKITAVDLSDGIIYFDQGLWISSYDIKNQKYNKRRYFHIKAHRYRFTSTRYSPYSCCLLKLSDKFPQKDKF